MKTVYLTLTLSVLLVAGVAHAIKVHQDLNMQGNKLINMGGNKITNLAPGTAAMDAVNVSQLEALGASNNAAVVALSNYVRDVMITSVVNYSYLTGQVDDTYVNVTGDTMTGPLTIDSSLTVNGQLFARDVVALTQTVLNITVSNECIVATNLQVQGIITGVQATNLNDAAVTYAQLTNAIGGASSGDLYVKKAGDTMTGQLVINAGGLDINEGGATVSGGVTVESGGVIVNGGHVVVNGSAGGQVQLNGANESIRVNNTSGKLEIWSGGAVALEFE